VKARAKSRLKGYEGSVFDNVRAFKGVTHGTVQTVREARALL